MLYSRKLQFKEEFYKLYYLPSYYNKNDLKRNIVYLQIALKAAFDDPIRALIVPKTKQEYLKYKFLLKMHLNYLITKNYVMLGVRFDKFELRFYNKPYREDIIKSLDYARYYLETALIYWKQVLKYYNEVLNSSYKRRLDLSYMEDVVYRIKTKQLDYKEIINKELDRIKKKKEYYKNM